MAMQALTIHDTRQIERGEVLAFDLIDVLQLQQSCVASSVWRCKHVECIGEQADTLHSISDDGTLIPGKRLLKLATGLTQVIDGDFEATRPGEKRWWLIVRAIDSSLYVIITEDEEMLKAVRERFSDVRDSPEDIEYGD